MYNSDPCSPKKHWWQPPYPTSKIKTKQSFMQGLLCSSIIQAVPRYDIDPMTFYLVWTGHGTAPVFGCSDSARIVPLAWLLTLLAVLGISAQWQWAKYEMILNYQIMKNAQNDKWIRKFIKKHSFYWSLDQTLIENSAKYIVNI